MSSRSSTTGGGGGIGGSGIFGLFGSTVNCKAEDTGFYCTFIKFLNVLFGVLLIVYIIYIVYSIYTGSYKNDMDGGAIIKSMRRMVGKA